MAERVDSPRVLNIADLRRLAKRRLPRVAFDYIDGGADAEVTLRENCRVFDDVLFRPRVRRRRRRRTCERGCSATTWRSPSLLAPVGSSRMFYPRGEVVAAARRWRGRYRLHAVDAVGLPRRRRPRRHEGPALVPALSRRRPRRRHRRPRTRDEGGRHRALRHHRHGRRRPARARLPERHQGAPDAQAVDDAPVRPPVPRRGRAGSPASSATAG